MNILITGASGNMGSHTTRHLLSSTHRLTLLKHKSELPVDIIGHPRVTVREGSLGQPETLQGLCSGIDCVVHFAGVLFRPRPERFLHITNCEYVANLLAVALDAGVKKFVLVSFPHVEGESTPANPASGTLDADPHVIHFRTRLSAEQKVLSVTRGTSMTPVIFRAGIVYGPDIKLIRAARWLMRRRLMAIWKEPTWVHLLAITDFLAALQVAIEDANVAGIYQICDDGPLLLQEFLDKLARHWGYARPSRLPKWAFKATGVLVEAAAVVFRTPSFVNRDIINAGMTSCVADTTRMKRELLPTLAYPTIDQGLALL